MFLSFLEIFFIFLMAQALRENRETESKETLSLKLMELFIAVLCLCYLKQNIYKHIYFVFVLCPFIHREWGLAFG